MHGGAVSSHVTASPCISAPFVSLIAQLPPVCKAPGGERDPSTAPRGAFVNWGYAFQAPAWERLGLTTVLLTHVFRQATDARFARYLQAMRSGDQDLAERAMLRIVKHASRPLTGLPEGIVPTQIFARNRDVDEMNASAFS